MSYAPGTLLNSYPTLVLFPAESSPHPVLWTDTSTPVKCQASGGARARRGSRRGRTPGRALAARRSPALFRARPRPW